MRVNVVVLGMILALKALAVDMDVRGFAECISDSGAKYYGAHWCPSCARQNELFGSNADYLPYVECSEWDSRETLSDCDHVKAFPTWVFANGQQRTGALSFNTLVYYSGCKLQEKNYFID